MCFSATASFTASGVLALLGGLTIHSATRQKHYLFLAITPFLFSIQQLAGGFVWFYVNQQDFSTARTFSVIFLFFALFFWITWIPIVAYTVETRTLFKRFFLVLSVIGFVFGLYLWLPTLLNSGPRHLISPYICHLQMCYKSMPDIYLKSYMRDLLYVSLGFLYLSCNDKIFRKFWIVVMLAAILTRIFAAYAWASVWCFFAALSCLYLIYLIKQADYTDDKKKMSMQTGNS